MAASTARQPISVALIGAGMIAKTHLAALSAAQDVARLKAVVSRRPERARSLVALYEGAAPDFTADLSAIAADPSIRMAIVATPPDARREVVETLAKTGTHILLEKPVGRSLSEAQEVVEICERAGVTLGIMFQHRARPPSLAAARHVASGALGQLGLVEIAVPLWRDQSYYDELWRGSYARDGGGVMITNAIHSIDLALSLTGPVTSVRSMTATTLLHRMEAEDFAVAGLRFACGAVGSLVAGTAMYPHRTEVIRLHFEQASLKIDKDELEISWRDGRRDVEAASGHAGDSALGARHAWHQAMIEDFIEAIQSGRKPMVTGREALISHRLIEAIETSSRTGGLVELDC
ncbi:MAG: putative dehydrogenase [Limimaricola cinnabarinus]|jgi:predicted dehydrogenase|uniref:Gfo/Idh/MocA family protein n=1 Tax=Limimaricola cinnabarinus TaxID=1125964 RepID=UPI0039E471FA